MSGAATPYISVIIPTFMRVKETEAAIRSVLAGDYPAPLYEILVVDGTSTDGTVEMVHRLQEEYPGRIYLFTKQSDGPSSSRNYGAKAAAGEVLAFLDSDCVAQLTWLSSAAKCFADDPAVGIVQGRTLPPPGQPIGMRARFVSVEQSNCIHDSCNIFYRKKAFDQAAGFDRRFYWDPRAAQHWVYRLSPWIKSFTYVLKYTGEDVDLGWRVLNAGWTKAFSAGALVYHEVRVLPPMRWLVDEACYAYAMPGLVKLYPALRGCFYKRYFLAKSQAFVLLFLAGAALGAFGNWVAVALCLPYIYFRAAEKTRAFKGVLRPLRSLLYLPKDLVTLCFLLFGSMRERSIVL